jgi:hemerythrin-like domain-containing protein
MTGEMTMNRVIHGAVRRDLRRLHDALGAVRDGDTERARGLDRAYAHLQQELTEHHQGEDQLVFPFLAGVENGVGELVQEMEDEHQAMAAALEETRRAMDAYAASGSKVDATAARDSIARTQAVVDRHLTHEEQDAEPLVAAHEQSAEWKRVEKQLRPRSVKRIGTFFAWVQDGTDPEAEAFLASRIPSPVIFVFSRLGGRGYRRDIARVWADGR